MTVGIMGLREIEKEIREAGQKEIEAINREASLEINKMRAEIKKKASSEAHKLEEIGRKDIELEKKRILSRARLQIREKTEQRKADILDKVFQEASSAIMKLSDREKARILKHLADEAKHGLEKPEIFVDSKYARLLKGSKSAALGEFGVRVKSGHITVDNTLSAKMNEIKSNLRHRVVDILWPK